MPVDVHTDHESDEIELEDIEEEEELEEEALEEEEEEEEDTEEELDVELDDRELEGTGLTFPVRAIIYSRAASSTGGPDPSPIMTFSPALGTPSTVIYTHPGPGGYSIGSEGPRTVRVV